MAHAPPWIVVLALWLAGAYATNADDREVYIVYMGSRGNAAPQSLFAAQRSALLSVFESELHATSAVIHNYKHAFSGFSARLTSKQAETLAKTSGVVSVFKSRKLELHTTHSWQFLGITANEFKESWENAKDDVIVGILDTGIWPESESFRDHGMGPVPRRWKGRCETDDSSAPPVECNRKLIGARSYYAGLHNGSVSEHDYTNARDSSGHGTHTASTVLGRVVEGASLYGLCKGNARGGFPRARIAVYKVCFYGDCTDDAVLAAFDDAVHDGVDLLSVSLGGPPAPFDQDSIAIGSFHAMKHGILVSCSAGNSGPFLFSVTNVAPWVLTVGSSSTNRRVIASVQLGNNEIIEGAGLNVEDMDRKNYPLVYGGDAAVEHSLKENASYCLRGSLKRLKVKGRIVLCRGGARSRIGSAPEYLESLGAAGVIQINELAKDIAFSAVLPFTIVDSAAGKQIISYLNTTRHPTAVIYRTQVQMTNKTASVSVFSSRGPSQLDLEILKPDILAPGSNILAAWTPVKSPIKSVVMSSPRGPTVFNILSGTSMSCPHAAGAAAFVKSFHPDWSPAMVKSALMTTASSMNIKDYDGHSETSPFDYGAGEMKPLSATDPGLVYDIDAAEYVHYLCALGYNSRKIEVITGISHIRCKDEFKASDLNYPTISISDFSEKKQTVSRVLTNVGPAESIYNVTVDAPEGVHISVSPSQLRFNSTATRAKFVVHAESKTLQPGDVSFGSLMWSDGGAHKVVSTILVVAS